MPFISPPSGLGSIPVATAFEPANYGANLAFWLDFDKATPNAAMDPDYRGLYDSSISSIKDRSSGAATVTPTSNPKMRETIDGTPVFYGNGASGHLALAGTTFLGKGNACSGYSYAMWYRPNVINTEQRFFNARKSTNTHCRPKMTSTGGIVFEGRILDGDILGTAPLSPQTLPSANRWYIIVVSLNFSNRTVTTVVHDVTTGVSTTNSGQLSASTASSTNTASNWADAQFGADVTPSNWMNGACSEAFLVNKAWTTGEISEVINYFLAKNPKRYWIKAKAESYWENNPNVAPFAGVVDVSNGPLAVIANALPKSLRVQCFIDFAGSKGGLGFRANSGTISSSLSWQAGRITSMSASARATFEKPHGLTAVNDGSYVQIRGGDGASLNGFTLNSTNYYVKYVDATKLDFYSDTPPTTLVTTTGALSGQIYCSGAVADHGIPPVGCKKKILILGSGRNDILSQSVANTWTAMQAVATLHEAEGWTVVLTTAPSESTSGNNSNTASLRTSVLAGSRPVIDIRGDSTCDDYTTDSANYLDTVHPGVASIASWATNKAVPTLIPLIA